MISKRLSVFSLAFIVLFTFTSILPLLEAKEGLEGKQGVSAEEGYQLSSMRIFNRAVLLMKEQYVEPDRFRPREMLVASLDAIEQKIPEIVVSEPSGDFVEVHVGEKVGKIAIGPMNSLWDLSFKLRDFFQFFEKNLPKETDLREIEYAAVNGSLSILDPHSNLLEPKISSELHLNTKGEFGGLGVVIGIRDGVLTVISPLDGTPAERAGIKALDRITKIAEDSTVNMALDEAVGLLRGPPGSTARLTIERKGESKPKKVELIREIIKIESVTEHLLSGGVGYIKVKSFHANTAGDVETMIENLKKKTKGSLKGLILDFRNNPGGLLDQSIDIADLFLDGGVVVVTQESRADRRNEKSAKPGSSKTDLPLVVLVNGGSASASEIVAGAIKNRERGLVLGEQSFGKGSVQMVYDFPDSSSLKLTIAQYLTPGNESIQSVGITPDIETHPVYAKDLKTLSLFAKNFPREEDQDAHLDNKDRLVARKSLFNLSYLDVKLTPAEFEKRVLEDKFREDFDIGLAKRILIETKGSKRKEMLNAAASVSASTGKEESAKVAASLKKLGIDWSEPPATAGDLKLEAKLLKPSAGKAGGDLEVQIEVRNVGKDPIFKLYGVSDSQTGLLEGREFIFGRLAPGERKKYAVKINIPKDALSRRDVLRVKFSGNGKDNLTSIDVPIKIEGSPRPVFAYSFHVDDSRKGNGDGLVQANETVDLVFDIKNTGEGDANEPFVLIKNLGGSELFIDEGRMKLKKIKAGASVLDKLSFTVRKGSDVAKIQFDIYDAEMGVIWTEKMDIPIRDQPLDVKKLSGKVSIDKDTVLFQDSSLDSRSIATVPTGVVGEQILRVGDRVRVRFSPLLSGFVKASQILPATLLAQSKGIKGVDSFKWDYRRTPPKIELGLGAIKPIVAKEKFKLDVKVTDGSALKDAWIFVNKKKVYYKQFNHKGPTKIEFVTDVKLKSGVNLITMVAREDKNYAQRDTITVFSDVGDPFVKALSAQR